MASFGEMLRRERELRQVTLREVAEATKINVRYLEALERDDFEYLPGGAFNKGFIRAYARYIGVDDAEMVDAYLYELRQQSRASDPDTGEEIHRLRGHLGVGPGPESIRRRRARIAVVVAAVLALALVLAGAAWGVSALLSRTVAEAPAVDLPPGTGR